MKRLLLLLIFISIPGMASAQEARLSTSGETFAPSRAARGDFQRLELTGKLLRTDEGRASLAEYRRLKELGLIPAPSKGAVFKVGETKLFSVRNLSTTEDFFEDLDFTLMLETPDFNIWVETAELDDGVHNGHVRDVDVEVLRRALADKTPAGSFDSNKGIIEIDETVFGPPPNVDGDDKTDVLVLDIRDTYDPDNGITGAIVGFFDPRDLTGGNNADIIYLDTVPGLVFLDGTRRSDSQIEQTMAHEYQHLIFASLVQNGTDLAFVNEGLSEWAEVVNGYIARGIDYFRSASERARGLLSWRDTPFFGGPGGEDYQRAGLFTDYLSERIGVLETGSLARSTGIGAANYTMVLGDNGLELATIIADFHVANLLNDRTVADKYGYATTQYSGVRVTSIRTFDGTAGGSTPQTPGIVSAGGVAYYRWDNVADIELTIDGPATLISPLVVTTLENGSPQVSTLSPGLVPRLLTGNYERVLLVVPHIDPSSTQQASFSFSAEWQPFDPLFETEVITYDNGTIGQLGEGVNAFPGAIGPGSLGVNPKVANRFDVPTGSSLRSVSLEVPFDNDFSGSTVPLTAPRDYMLHIWADNGAGLPGPELFSLLVNDNSGTGNPGFQFHDVNFASFTAQLDPLPAVIYIGVTNAGTDDNKIGLLLSEFTGGTPPPSFLNLEVFSPPNGRWVQFHNVSVGSTTMDGTVFPLRATFVRPAGPTATDDEIAIPRQVLLEQNYPNPFRAATSIRFMLPVTGKVRLDVYDMLGRRITTLVNEVMTTGMHEVTMNGAGLSSGLYLIALQTDTAKRTRTIMHVR